ncbi:MAG: phosphoglycerate dehydrogenase [Deltaproteobacteria bacterium]|nr:phosphoglycerate dehydrogenase [Deltaproteobacteria bacterium]
MTQKTVYVTLSEFCKNDETPRRILKEAGYTILENTSGRRIKKEEMFDALKNADAVVAAVEPYEAELLQKLPKLKVISRLGVGTDAIDLEAAKKLGIEVTITVEEIVAPVAEMTVAMILGLVRNFPLHANDFAKGEWKKHTGFLLSELNIGLIGFGRIARTVERFLKPFGTKVRVMDPFVKKESLPEGVDLCSLEELLKKSDIVSLHAARSPKEGFLLSIKEFSLMKPGSFLVNTARGYMVDEKALEAALLSKQLAGCALDVFEEEPYAGPLAKFPNVLLTPHVGTLTRGSRTAMEIRCAENVVNFFKKQEVL